MRIKQYLRATSAQEACELNKKKRNTVLGGGTWLRLGDKQIDTAIDLCDLSLDSIEETQEAFVIGAMVSLRDFQTHKGLNEACFGLCGDAVQSIVGVQFRALATVGGSVYGRFGFSDVLTCLMALGARVELHQGGIMPLGEFACMKRNDDILLRVIVPKGVLGASYQAVRAQKTDFALINTAVVHRASGWCLAVGARPGRAVSLCDVSPDQLAQRAADELTYDDNSRASAVYRRHLALVLSGRAIEEAKLCESK